jgi:hypothetical protein
VTRWISTWYYEQSADEGGTYAQVRGDSSTERFRDVYRRCMCVFFHTARLACPDARLVLFHNVEPRTDASPVARQTARILGDLGVERRRVDYTHAPPPTWQPAWRNQFYVLDALRDLAGAMAESDRMVLLDSDMVWTGLPATEELWRRIGRDGMASYVIDYPPDETVNGLSRSALTDLAAELGVPVGTAIPYSGGEFMAMDGAHARAVVRAADELWPAVQRWHAADPARVLEEAHFLSLVYASLGWQAGGAQDLVKRIWTQPFKFRNAAPSDLTLPLWHVPAEKRYGLRRMYADIVRGRPAAELRARMPAELGVPSNSRTKVVRDVSAAAAGRLRLALGR